MMFRDGKDDKVKEANVDVRTGMKLVAKSAVEDKNLSALQKIVIKHLFQPLLYATHAFIVNFKKSV